MTAASSLVTVRLLGTPVDLWQKASAHQEAIQREFDIMRSRLPTHSIPHRLLELISDMDARFGEFGQAARQELTSAAERGVRQVDLRYVLPPEAAQGAVQLKEMLAEVDAYCRSGEHLLTLTTPNDQVAFRNWVLDEFVRQIEQRLDPLPWNEHLMVQEDPGSPRDPGANVSTTETVVFKGDLDLATAGALRDTIQERRTDRLSKLTLDLTEVGFMDSVGISLLVATYNRLTEEGVEMRLIVPHRLYALLKLTGLTDLLKPEESIVAPG
jgi:anti-anti-sigma factor